MGDKVKTMEARTLQHVLIRGSAWLNIAQYPENFDTYIYCALFSLGYFYQI